MKLLRYILPFLTFININYSIAQKTTYDTVVNLHIFEVQGAKLLNFSTGTKIHVIDSSLILSNRINNLADLLSSGNQIIINSYGSGGLAEPSIRGTAAVHTAVLWNGFNLQSSLNGIMDLALIPVLFTDDVRIQYGGAGSGVIGGSIHFLNVPVFDKGLFISLGGGYGSFENYYQNITAGYSNQKFYSCLKVFNHTGTNDFTFNNSALFGNPEVKQTNNDINQNGVLFENYLKLQKDQQIDLLFWYQDNQRQLPPTMTESTNSESQEDKTYKISTEWNLIHPGFSLSARFAYFNDYLHYSDPGYQHTQDYYYPQTEIAEVEFRKQIANYQEINAGINYTHQKALVNSDTGNTILNSFSPYQNLISVFGSYKIHNKRDNLRGILNIREEYVRQELTPISPSLGLEWVIIRPLLFYGNVSRNYRIPTFNDLYWVPGGNPDLKPEDGWSEEAGLKYKTSIDKVTLEFATDGFTSLINNWISWMPGLTNSTIWTPENIQKVWSRGLECNLKASYSFNKLSLSISGNYNYTLSTNQGKDSFCSDCQGKQLMYVPIHNAGGNLIVSYAGMKLIFNYSFIGERYTATDNSSFVKSYQIGNLQISKEFQYKLKRQRYISHLTFNINNLWDENYQVIAWYAMPMRNYLIGLDIGYQLLNK